MTATEILDYMNRQTSNINMNLKKLGETITKMKIIKKTRSGGQRVYVVRKREPEEIQRLSEIEGKELF
jgi:predicted transcriptional regulator